MTAPVTREPVKPVLNMALLTSSFMGKQPLVSRIGGPEEISEARGRAEGRIDSFVDWIAFRKKCVFPKDDPELATHLRGIAESLFEYYRLHPVQIAVVEIRNYLEKSATEILVSIDGERFDRDFARVKGRRRPNSNLRQVATEVAKIHFRQVSVELGDRIIAHFEEIAARQEHLAA